MTRLGRTWLGRLVRRLALFLGVRPVRWGRVRVRTNRRTREATLEAGGLCRWWASEEDFRSELARLWRRVCRRLRQRHGYTPRLAGPFKFSWGPP